MRVLRVARFSARKARTQTLNQVRSLISTSPESIREELRHVVARFVQRRGHDVVGPFVRQLQDVLAQVGLHRFQPVMLQAFGNNLVWILLMVSGCVLFGLLIALLANQVKYEAIAKSMRASVLSGSSRSPRS